MLGGGLDYVHQHAYSNDSSLEQAGGKQTYLELSYVQATGGYRLAQLLQGRSFA
jgi:hypothetical protein